MLFSILDEQVPPGHPGSGHGHHMPGMGAMHEQGSESRQPRSGVGGNARRDVQQLRRADSVEDPGESLFPSSLHLDPPC